MGDTIAMGLAAAAASIGLLVIVSRTLRRQRIRRTIRGRLVLIGEQPGTASARAYVPFSFE